jgi:small conductance mechanosensitive channel
MDTIKKLLADAHSWSDLLADLWPLLVPIGFKILASIVAYFLGRKAIAAIRKVTDKMMAAQDWEPSVRSFVRSFIHIALMAVLIYFIVSILGITTTSLVALVASIGVALGMALSGTLQNFAGGLMILIFHPYKVGDYIEAQGQGGTVKEIQIFNTIIITVDNRTIYIPNGGLSANVIVNYNNQNRRRIEWIFNIAYGTDIARAKQATLDVLNAHPRILPDPAPEVVLKALGSSALDLQARAWVDRTDYWDVYYAVNEQIYNTFNTQSIEIPFPQIVVHQAPTAE